MNVVLRLWTLEDAEFCLKVRNHPKLKRWFRQDDDISLEAQKEFIRTDIETPFYNGQVILADEVPAGLCSVKTTGEFTIGVLPEFQKKGIATEALNILFTQHPKAWSEVFLGNPALEWYISKFNFKITDVAEAVYYKESLGLVDTIRIAR